MTVSTLVWRPVSYMSMPAELSKPSFHGPAIFLLSTASLTPPALELLAAPFLNLQRAWELAGRSRCQNHNKWRVSVCQLGSARLRLSTAGQAIFIFLP